MFLYINTELVNEQPTGKCQTLNNWLWQIGHSVYKREIFETDEQITYSNPNLDSRKVCSLAQDNIYGALNLFFQM